MRNLILCLIGLQAGNTQAQVQKFSIEGRIGQLNRPAKVMLSYFSENKMVIDSAFLKNGSFRFTGSVPSYVEAQLVLHHSEKSENVLIRKQDYIDIILENGKVKISGKDSLHKATIAAPPETMAYLQLRSRLAPLEKHVQKLYYPYSTLPGNQVSEQERERLMTEFKTAKDSVISQFIREFPDSHISLTALNWIDKPYPRVSILQPLFNQLSNRMKNTRQGKDFAVYLEGMAKAVIGAKAPEISQPDSTGQLLRLSDFKGKYVLVDFWASWCVPCRRENPTLIKAYETWKSRNFEILGIGIEKPGDRHLWLNAIAEDRLTWPQVSDLKYWQNEAVLNYGIKGVPQNFLIDPQGIIIAKNLHDEELLNKLKSIFNQP